MQVYTYSEARQKLALVLKQAESTGKVLIRRKDGRTFALIPEENNMAASPLDSGRGRHHRVGSKLLDDNLIW